MTSALSLSPDNNRHWLLRYVRLQQASDRRVETALRGALDSASDALSALEGKPGVSAAVRRAQLLGNRGVLSKVLRELYRELGDIIQADQMDAAALASQLLYEDEKNIWRVIEPDPDKRQALEDGLEAKARRNVQTMMTKVLGLNKPLSTRIYKSEALANGSINRVVSQHLARGSSAAELAKSVTGFFNPKIPGGVSSSAKRLARTEINNAFHAQSRADVAERPWIDSVRWNLSKSHPDSQQECACDRYAYIGTFSADDVPDKPHPNCLCYVTPVIRDFAEIFEEYKSGKFGNFLKTVV